MRMTEHRWAVLRALSDGRSAQRRDISSGFTDEQVKTMGGLPVLSSRRRRTN